MEKNNYNLIIKYIENELRISLLPYQKILLKLFLTGNIDTKNWNTRSYWRRLLLFRKELSNGIMG